MNVDTKSTSSNFMQDSTDATGTFSRVSDENRWLVASRKVRDVDDHDKELDDSHVIRRSSSRFMVPVFRQQGKFRILASPVLRAPAKPVLRRVRRSPQIERRPEEWTLDLDNEEYTRGHTRGTGGMRMRDHFGRRRA